jgi:hypothetical protein
MTGARADCAAGSLFGVPHQTRAAAWTLTSPTGDEMPLCSLFCALEWVTYQHWPAEAIHSVPADGVRLTPEVRRHLNGLLGRRAS